MSRTFCALVCLIYRDLNMIMKTKYLKSIYVLIIFGFLFAAFCIVVSAINPASKSIDIIHIFSIILQMAIGIAIIILSRKITRRFFHLFVGLLLSMWSGLSFMIDVVLPFSIQEMWPSFGVTAGIALFVSGYLKYRAVKFGYGIPSVVLFVMGIWYSLFSMNIIKMSFRTVVVTLGPFFMGSIALFLILFFLLQQKHKELVFTDEETGTFSDEETIFNSRSYDD